MTDEQIKTMVRPLVDGLKDIAENLDDTKKTVYEIDKEIALHSKDLEYIKSSYKDIKDKMEGYDQKFIPRSTFAVILVIFLGVQGFLAYSIYDFNSSILEISNKIAHTDTRVAVIERVFQDNQFIIK